MSMIDHKKGGTFSYSGLVKLTSGTWSAACKLFDGDTLVENLTVTLQALVTPGPKGETHSILLEATSAQTLIWPNKKLKSDILFTDSNGVYLSTSTFYINVSNRVTNG